MNVKRKLKSYLFIISGRIPRSSAARMNARSEDKRSRAEEITPTWSSDVRTRIPSGIPRNLLRASVIFSAISIAGFLVFGVTFAQYDYYDPYSNSNIDYFPSNPVYTSPSKIDGGTTGGSTSGGTSGGTTSGGATNTTIFCANKPKANPQNTRSVEIRDKSGKVFYLSPPKEELISVKAYPETSQQIFKVIYGVSGMQVDEKGIGLIIVDNKCYPKYGYVHNDSAVTSPQTSPSPLVSSNTQYIESTTVPENATAVNFNSATGEVFDTKTGLPINDARYDKVARKIYYRNTNSSFGKVLTDTTGYVNIDSRGLGGTSVAPTTTPLPTIKIKDAPKPDYSVTAPVSPQTPEVKKPALPVSSVSTIPLRSELPSQGKVVISFIEGGSDSVSVKNHENGEWQNGKVGMVLQQGYEILTNPDTAVSLLFADGARVRIGPIGQIKIVSYVTKEGVIQTEILLRVGGVEVEIDKAQVNRGDFIIRSPIAVASLRGTKFSMKYDKDTKESLVSVYEGSGIASVKKPWYLFWKEPTTVKIGVGQKASISKKRNIKVEIL